MPKSLSWQEELEIVDRTMKAISDVTDPTEFVERYWEGIVQLIPYDHYVSLSRRDVEPPGYLVTRSSRFEEEINPWKERHRLPLLSGGILGEIAYADRPVIIDDLPSRLKSDDPGHFYLHGFQWAVGLPHYDGTKAMNVSVLLLPPEVEFDPAVIPTLHWQSGLFGRGTHNLVLRNQLTAALASLDKELRAVGEIQRSLLPQAMPTIGDYDIAVHYKTSARAGGDYYDFLPLGDDKWGVLIADVSGHGTPAAVLMAITRTLVHSHAHAGERPGAMLAALNEQISRSYARGGTFVTAFYAVLDRRSRTLTYARAGHNPPRVIRDGKVISLDAVGDLPLGILTPVSYDETTVQLQEHDLLLLYTDGVTEAMAPSVVPGGRDLFGTERLDAVALTCTSDSSTVCIDKICDALNAFSGNGQPADDQTLIAVRCCG